jgi:hypothetical protein
VIVNAYVARRQERSTHRQFRSVMPFLTEKNRTRKISDALRIPMLVEKHCFSLKASLNLSTRGKHQCLHGLCVSSHDMLVQQWTNSSSFKFLNLNIRASSCYDLSWTRACEQLLLASCENTRSVCNLVRQTDLIQHAMSTICCLALDTMCFST